MAVRYFTLAQAQALLPQVRSLLGQALQLHAHLRTGLARLSAAGHEVSWGILREDDELDSKDPIALESLARARMIYSTLRERVSGIEDLGVEVKSVLEGLIDFRSWCDGELEVLLCYRLGESEITHFHGLEDGFDGRQPVEGHSFTTEAAQAEPVAQSEPLAQPEPAVQSEPAEPSSQSL